MSDLPKMINDVNAMKKKVQRDLKKFTMTYSELSEEVNKKFQEEYRFNNYKIDGLEEFQHLLSTCKKNAIVAKSTVGILSRISEISNFDISEETDTTEDKK
jgi:hypothetical protein